MKVLKNILLILITIFILVGFGVTIMISLNDNDNSISKLDNDVLYYDNDLYMTTLNEDNISYSDTGRGFVNNELSLDFINGIKKQEVEELIKKHNGTVVGYFGITNEYQIHFDKVYTYDEILLLKAEFEKIDIIEYVWIDYPFDMDTFRTSLDNITGSSNENELAENWGIKAIGADLTWSYIRDMQVEPVNVGVFDDVFDESHDDLSFEEKPMLNRLDNNSEHGTHVSGIIGALHNNEGMSGVAPMSKLYAISAVGLEERKIGNVKLYKYALTYLLVNCDVKVVNISLSANLLEFSMSRIDKNNQGVQNAIIEMGEYSRQIEELLLAILSTDKEFVICINAGNQGIVDAKRTDKKYRYTKISIEEYNKLKDKPSQYYGYIQDNNGSEAGIVSGAYGFISQINNPLIRERVITVGAVKNNNPLDFAEGLQNLEKYSIPEWSQYGNNIDILAPGEHIYSTIRNDDWGYSDGTSMAAPHVSGVAAIAFSLNPSLTGEKVKDIILSTATGQYGPHKMVNAYNVATKLMEDIGNTPTNTVEEADNDKDDTIEETTPNNVSDFIAPISSPVEGSIPISTREELENIKENPSGKYHLVSDIDLSNENWEPFDFSGVLDGQGHIISNLSIYGKVENSGLFATLDNATISNLGLDNIYIDTNVNTFSVVGGFCAFSKYSKISNCFVNGKIHTQAHNPSVITGGEAYAGGISGVSMSTSIINCYNKSDISADSGQTAVAGICADVVENSEIVSCYNTGEISVRGQPFQETGAGGICGRSGATTISYCFNSGKIDMGATYTGEICAFLLDDVNISESRQIDKSEEETIHSLLQDRSQNN